MKVVHLIWSLGIGGAENMLVDIINSQTQYASIDLIIINDIFEHSILDELSSKVTYYLLKRKPGSKNPISFINLNFLLYKLKPNIVHCHNYNLLKALVPFKYKTCLTVHDVRMKKDQIFNNYNGLFSISYAVQSDLKNKLNLHSFVIHNGITFRNILRKENYNFSKFRIVQIGRLVHEKKGQDLSITCIYELVTKYKIRNISLSIIGTGDSLSYLKDLVDKLNLTNYIEFLGALDRNTIYKSLHNFELLVQPSKYEGFGLTVVEAMAAGVPVLVSDIEGPLEIIGNEEFGYKFKSENVDDCTGQIILIMNNYKSIQSQLKIKHAYTHALMNFNITDTAANYIKHYNLLIGA